MISKTLCLSFICAFLTLISFAQSSVLNLSPGLRLPADTNESHLLISSLKGLLAQLKNANKDNTYVLNSRLPSTSALLDEIKAPDYAIAHLDNIAATDSNNYVVQFSYLKKTDTTYNLNASFILKARKTGDHYAFYSPLEENAQTWKMKKIGSFIFYYRQTLDQKLTKNYANKAAEFDRKLKATPYVSCVYFCDDAQQALELLGITYKAKYNGLEHDNFFAFENNQSLMVFGTDSFDPEALDLHDCWHIRLRYAPKPGPVNRFIDEGCAYLYGGSWGYSWSNILNRFKTVMAGKTDWLAVYNENKQFGESQEKHLYADYVINALLVKKLEKEKGFDAVLQFLCSGKRQKDNTDYFNALERLDGINRANFSDVVGGLLAE